ncbi:hypothetical protein N7474_002446 [Penicillium riverlandense]|uniref:uncharacterized protein n=1 Tax=Penicillium riverlandense TaxID=1903569 RepID=UPI0025471A9C|nr:uncharacterized protein N7474_002446 [Penicillium riverlandense]KAJ5825308.1 hypothetical protein N7474_002446 [Penicillium riverlandense]
MDLANLLSAPKPAALITPAYTPASSYTPSTGSYFPPTTTPAQKRSPPQQPPMSPPVDEQQPKSKCSLPSISTLLEKADGQHAAKRQRLSPPTQAVRLGRSQSYDVCLPPTPPMRPGSGIRSHSHSPGDLALNLKQESQHRQPPSERSSISSQASSTHHAATAAGAYASPAPSVSSYTSPVDGPPQGAGMYYPRPPATATFQPVVTTGPAPALSRQMPMAMPLSQPPQSSNSSATTGVISPGTPAWQHHHYFPPSSSAPYQQTHDRYICRTCHKAFSRPSSLRIHSHSHTGEKPFQCTHAGCGKAFSVRSNMKRHERGCHSGRPVTVAGSVAQPLVV